MSKHTSRRTSPSAEREQQERANLDEISLQELIADLFNHMTGMDTSAGAISDPAVEKIPVRLASRASDSWSDLFVSPRAAQVPFLDSHFVYGNMMAKATTRRTHLFAAWMNYPVLRRWATFCVGKLTNPGR